MPKSAHIHSDEVITHSGNMSTLWNRCVPIKVNVLIYRILLNKILTRLNLNGRVIEVHCLLCPICVSVLKIQIVCFCSMRLPPRFDLILKYGLILLYLY